MTAPSNIRINPFIGDGGTTNYVDFTEVHIIPVVSPFVVRLNEVPQKKDPSNMKVVYVDDTTGAPTTTALTEVAATPGAGEFRPDYSTNADGDEDWNTGLIEFSSADAGKSIQVSYTGMGTLAGVKNNRFPSWWLDRGDGSDGDFRPTANSTISGLKQYRSVFIPAGVTINVNKNVRICCQGGFINFGTISAVGSAGNGGGGGLSSSAGGSGTGGGNGGAGGGGSAGGNGAMINGIAIPSLELVMQYEGLGFGAGGGGGAGSDGGGGNRGYGGGGGSGGGAISIRCNSFFNGGTLDVSGNRGGNGSGDHSSVIAGGGGGGGGGSITVIAFSVVKEGTLLTNGGGGGSRYGRGSAGASGGAGIVKVLELGVM